MTCPHYAKGFTCVIAGNLHKKPMKEGSLMPIKEQEIEAQRGQLSCSRSLSQRWGSTQSPDRLSSSGAPALDTCLTFGCRIIISNKVLSYVVEASEVHEGH